MEVKFLLKIKILIETRKVDIMCKYALKATFFYTPEIVKKYDF